MANYLNCYVSAISLILLIAAVQNYDLKTSKQNMRKLTHYMGMCVCDLGGMKMLRTNKRTRRFYLTRRFQEQERQNTFHGHKGLNAPTQQINATIFIW